MFEGDNFHSCHKIYIIHKVLTTVTVDVYLPIPYNTVQQTIKNVKANSLLHSGYI